MIDPELRRMLDENLELSRENNKLLHKLHRTVLWGRVFRVLYWTVIIGAAMGAYYFVQPMIDGLLQTYQGLLGGVEGVQKAGESIPNLGDLFNR
ncbi:hypothetical protein ACFL0K_01125 [Patescibacteria group bacterium]